MQYLMLWPAFSFMTCSCNIADWLCESAEWDLSAREVDEYKRPSAIRQGIQSARYNHWPSAHTHY